MLTTTTINHWLSLPSHEAEDQFSKMCAKANAEGLAEIKALVSEPALSHLFTPLMLSYALFNSVTSESNSLFFQLFEQFENIGIVFSSELMNPVINDAIRKNSLDVIEFLDEKNFLLDNIKASFEPSQSTYNIFKKENESSVSKWYHDFSYQTFECACALAEVEVLDYLLKYEEHIPAQSLSDGFMEMIKFHSFYLVPCILSKPSLVPHIAQDLAIWRTLQEEKKQSPHSLEQIIEVETLIERSFINHGLAAPGSRAALSKHNSFKI